MYLTIGYKTRTGTDIESYILYVSDQYSNISFSHTSDSVGWNS